MRGIDAELSNEYKLHIDLFVVYECTYNVGVALNAIWLLAVYHDHCIVLTCEVILCERKSVCVCVFVEICCLFVWLFDFFIYTYIGRNFTA